jgi:hypothetical protein
MSSLPITSYLLNHPTPLNPISQNDAPVKENIQRPASTIPSLPSSQLESETTKSTASNTLTNHQPRSTVAPSTSRTIIARIRTQTTPSQTPPATNASLQKDYQNICQNLAEQLQSANQKITFLQSENELLTSKLSEQISQRSKLQYSKEEMARELEELSKSLFEEANNLVAKEAKERHELQLKLQKVNNQLEELKEQHSIESAQLKELKARLSVSPKVLNMQNIQESEKSLEIDSHRKNNEPNITSDLNNDDHIPSATSQLPKLEDLPTFKFSLSSIWPKSFDEWKLAGPAFKNSQTNSNGSFSKFIWSRANRSLFVEFCQWLNINISSDSNNQSISRTYSTSGLDAESGEDDMESESNDGNNLWNLTANGGHPLAQRIWEHEIAPTLSFYTKKSSKSFTRRLAKAIAANRITMEPANLPVGSNSTMVDPSFLASFSHFTSLSLTDLHISTTSTVSSTTISQLKTSTSGTMSHCSLCGMPFREGLSSGASIHKFSFDYGKQFTLFSSALTRSSGSNSSEESLLWLDDSCHARIVSVCDYFAFLRHYHAGLYNNASAESLFLHWIQLLRGMFYARTAGAGYFIASDMALASVPFVVAYKQIQLHNMRPESTIRTPSPNTTCDSFKTTDKEKNPDKDL